MTVVQCYEISGVPVGSTLMKGGCSVLWALRSTCLEHSHEGWLFSAMDSQEYLSGALS